MRGDLSNIYPTKTCFDDAMDLLLEAVKTNSGAGTSDELKLVHAICLTPKGEEYSHAWVESLGETVWFMGIYDGVKKQFAAEIKEYYEELRVAETIKYSPRQVYILNQLFGTYGPWTDRLRKLCNDSK